MPLRSVPCFALLAAVTTAACQPSAKPSMATGAEATPAPYQARGNEPFWSIRSTATEVLWATPETPLALAWMGVSRVERADGFDLRARRNGSVMVLSATHAVCRDSMSGMPYPQRVTVRVDHREYTGCGGDALDLLVGREWAVSSIAGHESGDRLAATVRFTADGSANGFTACNRWHAVARLTGEGIGFERIASTMMACSDRAMRQEQVFLDTLAKVSHHDFDATGALLLQTGNETLIVAKPVATPSN